MAEYIVTARKWRPMIFEDVAGQTHVTSTLRNAIASQRLAHAYLFSGPRGVGKTTTARLLAKAVNCLQPTGNNPDNTCDNCREITEGRSFDVLEIDGASNRGVEEIRNLRESVRYAPAKSRYKVYIIDEVHMLTKEAFNALLKTLEEPPSHVLFIFATTEIHKLPATILSRCQRFDFRRIAVAEILGNLKTIAREEGLSIDDDAMLVIAKRGDGSLRDAQSIFDQVVALCGRTITHAQIVQALNIVDEELYFRVTDLIRARDARGGIQLVDELLSQGHDLKEFLVGLAEHFRNLLIAKTTGSTTLIESSDFYRGRYADIATGFSLTSLLRYQRLVNGTENALRWSSHPRFRLEADMVQLITLPDAPEVAELIDGINELRKSIGRSDPGPGTANPASPGPGPGSHRPAPTFRPRVSGEPSSPAPPVPPAKNAPPRITEGEVSARWQEFVAEVRRKRISLGSTLETASLVGVKEDSVRLVCPGTFEAEALIRNRESLTEIFRTVFNVGMRFEVEARAGAEGGGANTQQTDNAAQQESDHPIIAAMKRELGAEPL
jgi:DNA polymerase III subunit gamma/tau